MNDDQKTNFLRAKLKDIKDAGEKISSSDASTKGKGFIYHLTLFLLQFFTVFGAQHYLLKKFSIAPFGLWEFFVIFIGFVTFVNIFKTR